MTQLLLDVPVVVWFLLAFVHFFARPHNGCAMMLVGTDIGTIVVTRNYYFRECRNLLCC